MTGILLGVTVAFVGVGIGTFWAVLRYPTGVRMIAVDMRLAFRTGVTRRGEPMPRWTIFARPGAAVLWVWCRFWVRVFHLFGAEA